MDNNSSDQTREVVEDFCGKYPGRFRYLLEPNQGVSYARNTGIRESRGEVVAFMDDDVTVEQEWLWSLTACLLSGEWAGVGGRIIPVWECSAPNWLSVSGPHSFGPFVAFDRGLEAGQLSEPPFGANMAFRREVFEKYGYFRTDLGRSGSNLLSNEDTEFGRRLLAGGERLRYEPSAVMHHPVTENRLQKSYLLAWWLAKGKADAMEMGISKETRWLLAGIPLRLYRSLAVWTLRWLTAVDSKKRFSDKLNVWNLAGQIVGCYQVSGRTRMGKRAFIEHRH